MKKVLLIIAVIAVLSGCTANTKTLTCTSETKSGNITSKTKYMIDYDGNDVKKLTATYDYKDNHTDGVGTGTDGTTSDKDPDSNGIVDGVVGEALDDVVTGVTDTILDISGIKTRHNTRFGSYTNTEGFTAKIDNDNDNDLLNYIIDEKYNPENNMLHFENASELDYQIKDKLTHLESRIYELRTGGMNTNEIAIILELDPKIVYNALQRIKNKIKDLVEN